MISNHTNRVSQQNVGGSGYCSGAKKKREEHWKKKWGGLRGGRGKEKEGVGLGEEETVGEKEKKKEKQKSKSKSKEATKACKNRKTF